MTPTTGDEPHRRRAGDGDRALARIRSDDKDAFAQIRRAMSARPDQPRPDAAVAWGDSGIYRMHLAGIRILYEVDDRASTVCIINVASTA